VTLPDGATPEYLTRTLYCADGAGQFEFVPALNAPKGRWHIDVTEAVSGATTRVAFDVK
jgi:hypothetical protein